MRSIHLYALVAGLALGTAARASADTADTTAPAPSALSPAPEAKRHERPKLAMMDLKADDADALLARNLASIVSVELQSLGIFQIITYEDLQSSLGFERDRQLLGCDDSDCLAQIAGALGVDRLMTGRLGRIGETFVLNFTIINLSRGARAEARVTRSVRGADALLAELKSAIGELTGGILEGLSGFIEPKVSEPGAEIRLDGKLLGVSPVAPLRFASGTHQLRVSKSGYIDWARDVTIEAGKEVLAVDVVLVPSPEYVALHAHEARRTRALAWTSTAVAGASAISAGGLYFAALNSAAENARAVAAAQAAKDANNVAAYDREAAAATRSMSVGEFQRNLAIGLGAAALAATGAAIYFWATGEDPARFERP